MRLLYLNPIGALGGAERSALDIFAAIRALEPTWELRLILGADGELRNEAERMGVTTEVLPLPDEFQVLHDPALQSGTISSAVRKASRALRAGLGAWHYAGNLRLRIAEFNPDVIHSNAAKFHLLTRLMMPLKAPVIWHLRDFVGSRKLLRHALRWAEPAATLAIANSNAVAAEARTVFRSLLVRTVLNCVDTERFSLGPASGAEIDGIGGVAPAEVGTLRVGMLASFARWKGQDLFLKAAAQLKQSAPDLRVRFYVGGGPIFKAQGSQFSLDELRSLAQKLDLAECVVFVPFQNEPERFFRSMDVVVHCSTEPEPFGRTIAEAMACGRAVVASLAGGVPELFEPGVEALGAKPNDAADFARLIEWALRNRVERATLEKNARLAACDRFSRARLGQQMRAIYREMTPNMPVE